MKQKTHSGAKKRFRITKNGKVMTRQRNRAHILEKKSSSRKRRLKGQVPLAPDQAKQIKRLLNQG
ncbi:MAG: 50S ribosomal protein L35 [Actinobacteria bacterium]|nr:50S ribosomal protein L35 [Actinomycetota bacterium]